MESFGIRELYGSAWHNAIKNIGSALEYSEEETFSDWRYIQKVAFKLNVRFDMNGNII